MNIINKTKYSSAKTLFFIGLICLIPYLSAKLFYHYGHQIFSHRTNYGILITPPPSLQSLHIATNEKWRLFYLQEKKCDALCLDHLILLNKLRDFFGEKADRIATGILTTSFPSPASERGARGEGKETQITIIDTPLFQTWIKQFPPELQSKIGEGYLLVDPHDNVILYYPPNANPKDLYEDLKRLLKASRIG